jgi:hypothetical protein
MVKYEGIYFYIDFSCNARIMPVTSNGLYLPPEADPRAGSGLEAVG